MADDEMLSQDSDDSYDDDYVDYSDYDFACPLDDCNSPVSELTPSTSTSSGGDPENFDHSTLQIIDVERLLNEAVAALSEKIPVTPSLAKVLLHNHNWNIDLIVERYNSDFNKLLIDTHIKPSVKPSNKQSEMCHVCASVRSSESFRMLSCGHGFCSECWNQYIFSQLSDGTSAGIECMHPECKIIAPEDFVVSVLDLPAHRAKYEHFMFQDHVKSHPHLRFCPGPDCNTVIRARIPAPKNATCGVCKTSFCFQCAMEYHAPTSCDVIKQWMMKCADDSETANYITANTKDCPKCQICIEKNGGCNHMQCFKCKHHFCWMCLGDWKHHGTEYYECSRYKENPKVVSEAMHVKAREALQKYLHYFERWENHNKSLKLEEKMLDTIRERIEHKINCKEGTWIDWQYLYDAAALLTKCRYTLQYTYPYAYYMGEGARKNLFEYQQSQLEVEIENLSWKVERSGSSSRGELETQMHIAEQKRRTLLKDFFV